MTKSVDCVFVTVPYTDTHKPLMAPAILKSIAMQAGKTAATIDFNAEFQKYISAMEPDRRYKALAFFREEQWHSDIMADVLEFIKHMATKILLHDPAVVGISVFTYNCRSAAKYLSWALKKIKPSVQIILGGPGIMKHFSGRAEFAEQLRLNGVIDFYVYGDGEKSLLQYLTTGKTSFVGINTHNWIQMTRHEVEILPMPDYDDYDFSLYQSPVSLPILSSRGCVRQCKFCDYHVHWEKFTYRSGQAVFDEIMKFHQQYKTRQFDFADSLVNGNLREYRVMVKLLADFNRTLPEDQKIVWNGFFIFRPQQSFTEEDWRLTIEGGGRGLAVGIETLNDQVRQQLGKSFTNQDIEFSLQMARKYGSHKVQLFLLFFTGYPSETQADYDFQVEWWKNHMDYKDVIYAVNTGSPLSILENTPLQKDFEKMGLEWVGPNPEDWVNPANGNTPEQRIKWNELIIKTLEQCGFQNLRGHDTHYILERMKASL
jgi:radical SAM superfamily enzyme YgiQ (UPF0313 family)